MIWLLIVTLYSQGVNSNLVGGYTVTTYSSSDCYTAENDVKMQAGLGVKTMCQPITGPGYAYNNAGNPTHVVVDNNPTVRVAPVEVSPKP